MYSNSNNLFNQFFIRSYFTWFNLNHTVYPLNFAFTYKHSMSISSIYRKFRKAVKDIALQLEHLDGRASHEHMIAISARCCPSNASTMILYILSNMCYK